MNRKPRRGEIFEKSFYDSCSGVRMIFFRTLINIFNELFSITDENEICTLELAQLAIENKINSYKPLFQNTLSLLPERQKEILYAIANEGKASAVTSGKFIKKHGLLSQSSVQTAVNQLFDKEIITSENNVYQVYDRFFGLWLANLYGTGWKW